MPTNPWYIPMDERRHPYTCAACRRPAVASKAAPAYRLMLTQNVVGLSYKDAQGRFTLRGGKGEHAPATSQTSLDHHRRIVDQTICGGCAYQIQQVGKS